MHDKLLISLLKNDFKKNKAVSITLFFFLFISALLMATGASVTERLTGALEQMYEKAEPPHFLQMHVGDIDREKVGKFVENNSSIEKFHIQDMANLEGVQIDYIRKDGTSGSFSDSLFDNYFVSQSDGFDYLLDTSNNIASVGSGEIGLPVGYSRKYKLAPGDRLKIKVENLQKEFTVKYLVRDAQMGSSLASSIRFLVNKNDFEEIYKASDRKESILAFRLKNPKDADSFQSKYLMESEDMPKNGVAITLPLIKMVNGLGDGLMSGVIFAVSFVLIVIALLNIRFTLLGTLEEEVREIGTLKAIGLRNRDINMLYKSRYLILTAAACFAGLIFSFPLTELFITNISLNFGLGKVTIWRYIIPAAAVILLFIFVSIILNRILGRISRMTIIDTLKEGRIVTVKNKRKRKTVNKAVADTSEKAEREPGALKVKNISPLRLFKDFEFSLSLHDLKVNFRNWILYILIFLLASFIILIPLNMYMTVSSPQFVRYMGSADSDVRALVNSDGHDPLLHEKVEESFGNDGEIEVFNSFRSIGARIDGENGKETFIVESGDFNKFPITPEQGRLPHSDGEIAVSSLNSERLGKKTGDIINLYFGTEEIPFKIVGVYQDITNGGKTAKITQNFDTGILGYQYYIKLKNKNKAVEFSEGYQNKFSEIKILPVQTMLNQTLGTISGSLITAVIIVFIMAVTVCALISLLFMSLQIHKNIREDTTLNAIGVDKKSIKKMYLIKSILATSTGIILGAVLSVILGEPLVGVLFRGMGFGITRFIFTIKPLPFILLGIVIPLIAGVLATMMVTEKEPETRISELGNS